MNRCEWGDYPRGSWVAFRSSRCRKLRSVYTTGCRVRMVQPGLLVASQMSNVWLVVAP